MFLCWGSLYPNLFIFHSSYSSLIVLFTYFLMSLCVKYHSETSRLLKCDYILMMIDDNLWIAVTIGCSLRPVDIKLFYFQSPQMQTGEKNLKKVKKKLGQVQDFSFLFPEPLEICYCCRFWFLSSALPLSIWLCQTGLHIQDHSGLVTVPGISVCNTVYHARQGSTKSQSRD